MAVPHGRQFDVNSIVRPCDIIYTKYILYIQYIYVCALCMCVYVGVCVHTPT